MKYFGEEKKKGQPGCMILLKRRQNQVFRGLTCGSFRHKEKEGKKRKEKERKRKKLHPWQHISLFFFRKHAFIWIRTFQLDKTGCFVRILELKPM